VRLGKREGEELDSGKKCASIAAWKKQAPSEGEGDTDFPLLTREEKKNFPGLTGKGTEKKVQEISHMKKPATSLDRRTSLALAHGRGSDMLTAAAKGKIGNLEDLCASGQHVASRRKKARPSSHALKEKKDVSRLSKGNSRSFPEKEGLRMSHRKGCRRLNRGKRKRFCIALQEKHSLGRVAREVEAL